LDIGRTWSFPWESEKGVTSRVQAEKKNNIGVELGNLMGTGGPQKPEGEVPLGPGKKHEELKRADSHRKDRSLQPRAPKGRGLTPEKEVHQRSNRATREVWGLWSSLLAPTLAGEKKWGALKNGKMLRCPHVQGRKIG